VTKIKILYKNRKFESKTCSNVFP